MNSRKIISLLSLIEKCLAYIFPLLLLAVYPIALFTPAGTGVLQRFYFSFPAAITAALLAAILFCLGEYRTVDGGSSTKVIQLRNSLWIALGLLFFLFLLGRPKSPAAAITFLALFALPFWPALAHRRLLPTRLPIWLGVVWLIHSSHVVWEIFAGQQAVGICGNRNWMAAFSLALTPWALTAVGYVKRKRDQKRPAMNCLQSWLVYGAYALILAVTFGALWYGRSRAVWLVLAVFPLWTLAVRLFSVRFRIILAVLMGVAAVSLTLVGPGVLEKADADGVRLPMWQSTMLMIAENPWVGVGAGNFRREFPEYRQEQQMASPKAASVTDHPHNEFLHLAVSLGLPAALLWLALLYPLVVPPKGRGKIWRAEYFAAFVLVAHGMLDLTLWQQPTGLLALFCLGLLWRPLVNCRVRLPSRQLKTLPAENFSCAVGEKGKTHAFCSNSPSTGTSSEGAFSLKPSATTSWAGLSESTGETIGPRPVQWLAAAVMAGLLLWLAGQQTLFSWYMRQGAVAEVQEEYAGAVQAYSRAMSTYSQEVKPYVYAGSLTLGRLQKPSQALTFLAAAYNLEPDFGHLNGELARALSAVGKDEQALRFYRREAFLFPFNPLAQDNLLTAKLVNRQYSGGIAVVGRAQRARQYVLRQELGEDRTRELAHAWRQAVVNHQSEAALKIAVELTRPVIRGGALPYRQEIVQRADFRYSPWGAEFSAEDWQYWNWLANPGIAGVEEKKSLKFPAIHQVERIRSQGGEAAVLMADGEIKGIVAQADDGGLVYQLLSAGSEGDIKIVEKQCLTKEKWNTLQSQFQNDHSQLRLRLPISPWDVLERQRVLAMTVQAFDQQSFLAPPVPPALRKYWWRTKMLADFSPQTEPRIDFLYWHPPRADDSSLSE